MTPLPPPYPEGLTTTLPPLSRVRQLLSFAKHINICVIGDVCLDMYFFADMRLSTLSRETPHYNMPVTRESVSLGAGGNVISNLSALSIGAIKPVSVIGRDWRGELVIKLLKEKGMSDEFMLSMPSRVTPAYIKPVRMGYGISYEDPRLDFENHEPLDDYAQSFVISAIDEAVKGSQVVVVCDQFTNGVVGSAVRKHIVSLSSSRLIIADSRENIADFRGCVLKPNEIEAARAANIYPKEVTPEAYMPVARALHGDRGVVITLGEKGALAFDGYDFSYIPGIRLQGPVDIVGAGDAFLAAFALAMGAGAALDEACWLGNLAACVTVQKIGETGTASPEEIIALYERAFNRADN